MNDEIKDLKAKKKDYIDSYLPFAVEFYKSVFEKYKAKDQINKATISIVDQNQIEIG